MHTIRLSKGEGGLGFKVDKRNAIIGLTAGGAAERAGLRVGDVAWAVNGEALEAGERLASRLSRCRPCSGPPRHR